MGTVRFVRGDILFSRTVTTLRLDRGGVITSNATNNNNRSHRVTGGTGELVTVSHSPSTIGILNRHLTRFSGMAVIRSGFTGVGDVLGSLGVNKVSNFLLSLNMDSFRLSGNREKFSFRRSTPLSVQVSGRKLSTESIIGGCSRRRLTSVVCHCNRRGFDHDVTTGVITRERGTPVRAAFRLISVVGRSVPTGRLHGKRPTEGAFRTVEVRIGNRLSGLGATLSSTFSYLGPNKVVTIVAFRSLRSEVIGRGFTR